ncbi:sulfoxide reductase heme-binding subunit YedZ [Marinospirillum celere]|uniref:Sulfoxide reductase heme-binding subunit YedZ n=1 Tax=Marinospirillum celere TaxID=1122252 RepID=A0A1I1HL39_9GAMM|nr:ferric reductase-like transmembrane domain-containing protein [Marinospirillum celere]SFC22163.1 sulfoxide reductase heme-binding subunit YedZ [Marinospirillum celere]
MPWFRWLVFGASISPALWLAWLGFQDELGVFPEETLMHWTGRIGLTLLLITIAWGFAWRFTCWVGFIATRRQLGLWAFWWLTAHLLIWLGWDQGWQWAWAWQEISELLHLQLGLAAWLILALLALTSPTSIRRAMPELAWKSLHRFIYLASALGIWHLWIATRIDYRMVTAFAAILAGLLLLRLIFLKPPGAPSKSKG